MSMIHIKTASATTVTGSPRCRRKGPARTCQRRGIAAACDLAESFAVRRCHRSRRRRLIGWPGRRVCPGAAGRVPAPAAPAVAPGAKTAAAAAPSVGAPPAGGMVVGWLPVARMSSQAEQACLPRRGWKSPGQKPPALVRAVAGGVIESSAACAPHAALTAAACVRAASIARSAPPPPQARPGAA